MLISVVSVAAFANDSKAEQIEVETLSGAQSAVSIDCPIIFVTGIGQSYSYFYEDPADAADYENMLKAVKDGTAPAGTRETDKAKARWNLFCNDFSFAFKEPAMIFALLRIVGGLMLSTLGHNFIPESAVNKVVRTLFRYNLIDEEGKLPANMVTPRCYYPLSEYTDEQRENFFRTVPCEEMVDQIGRDNVYCFNYSAFSFTYNNAKDLRTFINDIVLGEYNKTGAEKVVLIPMSMGASVVSAYLQKYGTEGKVARVVSIVGAWYGSDVIGDLMELNFADNAPELLYNGIVAELVGEPAGYAVNILLRIFPKKVLRSIIDELLGTLVQNIILRTPSLLALIPYERYPAVRAKYLENNPELAYIMKMTDDYYECQKGLEDRLRMLNSDYGVEFYFLAGYDLIFGGYSSDYKFFQFMKSAETTNSDEIIQISSTAPGSVYAPVGQKLATYGDEEYVTPDKSVDISGCFFPDHVWLFKGQKHELENNNTALRLSLDLACGKVTSSSNSIYPRFNESRDLKALNRNYLPDLREYVAAKLGLKGEQAVSFSLEDWVNSGETGDALSSSQIETLKAVFTMKNSVVNNRTEDDKVIENLYDMMCDLGIYEKSQPTEKSDNSFLKKLNDRVYKIFGAKGFVDIFSSIFSK